MDTVRKKLIEVALPLKAINIASAREKSIRHGHPSTLHLWWARRPLAAARAVIFAQMVDDPSANPDLFPTEKAQQKERARLFNIIEELVKWENTTNEDVLDQARDEIWQSWRRTCAQNADHPRASELFDRDKLPAFHDPFAGGGALPLEAQRLGLRSFASDLNPVAVLINKAMIEIPPRFAGQPPVHTPIGDERALFAREWRGAQGLGEDVRVYGRWMRDEAEKRIGHLYPKCEVTVDVAETRPDLKSYVGRKLTVVAWLWARTVKSPNPAFANIDVPLVSTFMLSTKPGKEVYVEPVVDGTSYRFTVRLGVPPDPAAAARGTKADGRGANFVCLMSGAPITGDYIKTEGMAGRMGARLMAIVADADRRRVYVAPSAEMEEAATTARPHWKPDGEIPKRMTGGNCTPYGLVTWGDLFTPRQLVALDTFSDLLDDVRRLVQADAVRAGLADDAVPLRDGGAGALAYSEAVAVYLAFATDKVANWLTTISHWWGAENKIRPTFTRQAIPMTWDYSEANPLAGAAGDLAIAAHGTGDAIARLPLAGRGVAVQRDAIQSTEANGLVISTDPPYYDNIGYADLSDFFYVWLRRSLRPVFPDLFSTVAVPKAEELVATPYRHGGRDKAEAFFLAGMTQAMQRLAEQALPSFPITIYYAFKQSETVSAEGTSSTGWETFLDAVIQAGLSIGGTWPVRTENAGRMVGQGANALASSIVLVCRKRDPSALTATRREFLAALKEELPRALLDLQRSNIAPVDLAQAAIGPGMAVYTRYKNVLDAEGKPLGVRDALASINQVLDDALAEQEGDFDSDTRWALTWFDEHGFSEAEYGLAEQLSKSKNTSVAGMVEAGILESKRGRVRLLKPAELPADWNPATDSRLTVWEAVHQLIRVLEAKGESAAAQLVAKLGATGDIARELAYRLYVVCERKRRSAGALSYNALVHSFPELERLAKESPIQSPSQPDMLPTNGEQR